MLEEHIVVRAFNPDNETWERYSFVLYPKDQKISLRAQDGIELGIFDQQDFAAVARRAAIIWSQANSDV